MHRTNQATVSRKPELRGHSADVRMELRVNGCVFPIGQLGPNFIILDNPSAHAPTEGEIHMWIDDEFSQWRVRLPDGIDPKQTRTNIV
jgi:hypothetical protein